MEQLLILAAIISVLFFILKLVEEKLKKKKLNVKEALKNTILVFLCSVIGIYAKDKLKTPVPKTDVFVGDPTF